MDKQSKSAKDQKREKVATLAEKITRAKSITFVNYHGLAANQIAKLRNKIKETEGELLVEKNTLLSRALQNTKYLPRRQAGKIPNTKLTGPTAAILAYNDEVAPIKEASISQKESGSPTFKFALLEGTLLDISTLETLAKLPAKNQLRANLVGSLQSPIYGFINVLGANIRNLVSVLDQAAKKSDA